MITTFCPRRHARSRPIGSRHGSSNEVRAQAPMGRQQTLCRTRRDAPRSPLHRRRAPSPSSPSRVFRAQAQACNIRWRKNGCRIRPQTAQEALIFLASSIRCNPRKAHHHSRRQKATSKVSRDIDNFSDDYADDDEYETETGEVISAVSQTLSPISSMKRHCFGSSASMRLKQVFGLIAKPKPHRLVKKNTLSRRNMESGAGHHLYRVPGDPEIDD